MRLSGDTRPRDGERYQPRKHSFSLNEKIIIIKNKNFMKKYMLIFTLIYLTSACKSDDLTLEYISNYVGTFTETRTYSNGSVSITDQKDVYEITFSKRDNQTLNMDFLRTHTEKNNGRPITPSKYSYSLQNVKIDKTQIIINENIKQKIGGGIPDLFDFSYTGKGVLNQSTLTLELNATTSLNGSIKQGTSNEIFILVKK